MAFFTVLSQVSVLFLLMGVGYAMSKAGMIDDSGSSQMTSFLCYVISPDIIVYSFLRKFSAALLGNLLIVAASTAAMLLLNITVGKIAFNKKTVKDSDKRSAMKFASTYPNCGFMGFPLLQSLAGSNGLFYGSAINGVFNLFSWSHGMQLYTGKVNKRSIIKAVVNPNIIAVLVGAILFYFSISLPGPIYSTVKYISLLNTPLSMIVIGTTLTKLPLRTIFTDRLVWLSVALRNIVLPFALLFLLFSAGLRGQLLLCCMIPAACPTAGVTVLFAKLTKKDVVFPGKLMTLSTLLSLITMPIIVAAISAL